jgi:hypothetical protein
MRSLDLFALCLLLAAPVSLAAAPTPDRAPGLFYNAALSGAQVVPEVESPAGAVVRVAFDPAFSQVRIAIETTAGLHVTSAQLGCGFPGEQGNDVLGLFNPGPLFEIRSGTEVTLDQRHLVSAGCERRIGRSVHNLAALALAMREGLVYVTLGTQAFPAGELRGQFLSVAEVGEIELPDDRLVAPFPR